MLLSEDTSQAHAQRNAEMFLSYNRNDSVLVEEVALELKRRGVNVWLDASNLAPGARWKQAIDEAFERADSIAVCIGGHGLGGWQKLELELALAKLPERERRLVPILLPDAPRSLILPAHLSRFMACDLRMPDRSAQLDNVAAVLLADSEWPETATRRRRRSITPGAPSWLHAFFESAGTTLDLSPTRPEMPRHAAIHDPSEPVDQ